MQTQGSIKSISISFPSKRAVVAFEMAAAPEDVEKYQNKDLDITFEEHREKRSLSANSYFWKLVNLIAREVPDTDIMIHDRLLSENRAYIYNEDGAFDWKVSPKEPNCYGLIHEGDSNYYIDSGMKVTMQKPNGDLLQKNGVPVEGRIYWHIKGSHQMDRAEMSRLIDAAIREAEQLHIQTLTQNQLKLILDMWDRKRIEDVASQLEKSKMAQQELNL